MPLRWTTGDFPVNLNKTGQGLGMEGQLLEPSTINIIKQSLPILRQRIDTSAQSTGPDRNQEPGAAA